LLVIAQRQVRPRGEWFQNAVRQLDLVVINPQTKQIKTADANDYGDPQLTTPIDTRNGADWPVQRYYF
jgi:hypothetical protein